MVFLAVSVIHYVFVHVIYHFIVQFYVLLSYFKLGQFEIHLDLMQPHSMNRPLDKKHLIVLDESFTKHGPVVHGNPCNILMLIFNENIADIMI